MNTRAKRLAVVVLVIALTGCGSALTVATRTIETTAAALEPASRTGEAAHRAEIDRLTAEATEAREALGCGSGESLPATCDKAAWKAKRDDIIARSDAAKKRYERFKDAILTTDTAVVLAADAVIAWDANKKSPNLSDIIQRLVRAYQQVSSLLREMGVDLGALGKVADTLGGK